jgi:hypothetical protein
MGISMISPAGIEIPVCVIVVTPKVAFRSRNAPTIETSLTQAGTVPAFKSSVNIKTF